MPTSPKHHDQPPADSATEQIQPAVDAAAGEPRSGDEPGRGASAGRSGSADEHTAPVDQPSQDNTDRRV